MKIKELENKRDKNMKEDFKTFYKKLKKFKYNTSIKTILNMYKIYVG